MKYAILFTLALSGAIAGPAAAIADKKIGPHGTVTACSANGHHGCVTAPVRMVRLGLQYRSPGGSWTWCEHDCRDTLRRDTIDFWDDQRERSK